MKPPASRSVSSIVEEQISRWSTQKQERDAVAGAAAEHWPLITVSREFGSLGASIGRVAADRLGFTFWDQELVHLIAEQTGAQETLLASLDETARGKVEEFVANVFFGTGGTAAEYVREVARVVRALDRKGGAVVVGRGGQFILGAERALRVRVVSPMERRVEGYADRQGFSVKEAEREVKLTEEERRTFIRQHYQKEIGDPANYDLVLNTEALDREQAAHVVVSAYRAKFGRLPPRPER